MTDECPRQRSPLWIMGSMLLIAWVGCGVYRHQMPPLTVVRAVLQVPSATDLSTLCLQPDIYQAAVKQLEADGDIYITFENQSGKPQLSGKLTVAKLQVASSPGGLNAPNPTPQISTESWELTYRTPRPERALGELSALIAVLEPLIALASSAQPSTDKLADTQLTEVGTTRHALQQELDNLAPAAVAGVADPIQLVALQDRVQSLQRALTESQIQRLQFEEEWRLLEQELALNPRLEATAAKLSVGPVQEAVLQVDRQRKLSRELTRLNDTERRLGNIYGDKHPQLVELRQKFEQVLAELGGWENVLNEQHAPQRLQASLEQLLKLKQRHETDLQTQLDLEQQDLSARSQSTERRIALTAQIQQLDRELAVATQRRSADVLSGASAFAVQQAPEIVTPHWSGNLTVLMAIASAGGLIMGAMLHRLRSHPIYSDQEETSPRSTPVFAPIPVTELDLAQRRAMRQARLQQAYAG